MRRTYLLLLQSAAVVLMLAATAFGHFAAVEGRTGLVLINTALFGANMALFIWQSRLREKLRKASLIHPNGKPKWGPDGTLLDDKGNRSVFDDIDT